MYNPQQQQLQQLQQLQQQLYQFHTLLLILLFLYTSFQQQYDGVESCGARDARLTTTRNMALANIPVSFRAAAELRELGGAGRRYRPAA